MLICTPEGTLPTSPRAMERVEAALATCGVWPWEMFSVDNSSCGMAPLSVPEDGDVRWAQLKEVMMTGV